MPLRRMSVPTPPTLTESFIEFHRDNPHIYLMFDRFTWEIIERGLSTFSVDALFHRMRWYTDIETSNSEGFKLNNDHTAFYARLWMLNNPTYNRFFKVRASEADALFANGIPFRVSHRFRPPPQR